MQRAAVQFRPDEGDMFRRTTSIRGKITAGYVLGFFFLLAFAAVLFLNLLAAEDRIGSYSGISRFLDTALEMRRSEKNYLLYGKREDLDAAIEYAGAADALVEGGVLAAGAGASRYPEWLRVVADVDRGTRRAEFSAEETSRLIDEYRTLLRAAGDAREGGGAAGAAAIASIRDTGRRITEIAERLSAVEGENIQALLRSGRRKLIAFVAVFLVGTAVIARVVRSTAIRPLHELELGMQRIAAGDFRTLPADTGTDEIDSMNTAFNRMIREVFEHKQERIQSERLASLGTMLAGIAHELNNPLANVSTSAEILKENPDAGPEDRRELVDQIVSQTDRATSIIRTVLDFSRQPRFERRPTNLLDAVCGAVILVRGEMPAHVSVDMDVPTDLEIPADKSRLQQAFVNLMKNSLDAMREAGREGAIVVSARAVDEKEVEVVFRDGGAGIPPALLDKIFEPFFSTKDVGHGTGLGLYITHQIVQQHGGTIRVESAAGEGTTVTLRLPREAPPAAANAPTRGEGAA
jgi:two-component system NtrC family sensor kinase